MTGRSDLLLEVDTTLDISGNYTGPWIDSSGIRTIVMVWSDGIGGTAKLNLSEDGLAVIRNIDGVGSFGEYQIPARYFRLQVSAGSANATFRVTIRAFS